MRIRVKNLVESSIFQRFILVVIIINTITLGVETSKSVVAILGKPLEIINAIAVAVFTIEIVLKLLAYDYRFFKDGFNIFDFFVVAISYVPAGGSFSALRAARAIRAFRALRVATSLKRLRIIIEAILQAIPSIGWVSFLLLIVYYIFGIIGTNLFGEEFPAWFGTLGRSMYTLFQVMTLESWSMGISRPVMEVFPYAFLYFIPFILISAFVVLNVVVGVVVSAIGDLSAAEPKNAEPEKCEASPRDASYKKEEIRREIAKLKTQLENLEKFL